MSRLRMGLLAVLLAGVLMISARMAIWAQDNRPETPKTPAPARAIVPARIDPAPPLAKESALSVQNALEQPFSFPFTRPTRLDEVCRHLGESLRAPVVLDRAALDRQDLRLDDTVELALEGVRLKTGLKLLLDQVRLTFKVVPEDNLLILTDAQGSDNPLDRVVSELKALHRDVHDLQDAVDQILDTLNVEEGTTMRKPTIIEEVPAPAPEPGAPPAQQAPAPPPQARPRSG